MKFKVLRESYIFGELYQEGAIANYPDEHLPRDADGNIRFEKLSNLEPVDGIPEKKPSKAVEGGEGSGEELKKPAALTPAQKAESIKLAVAALDPANPDDWTEAGLPDINAVVKITGFKATRAEITEASDNFVRPTE